VRPDALTPALSHGRGRKQILRDFFFHRPVKEKKIWPLRLKVAEKKHGGE
jgi:hypothetical protein